MEFRHAKENAKSTVAGGVESGDCPLHFALWN